MPDSPILYLVVGGLVLGFGAWAGWTLGARRAGKARPLPGQLWLCDTCHSFNEPEREACYGCHRPRPADARSVVPDAEFHVDQRFGQGEDEGGRGSTRPWLGAVDPLRDEWLVGRPSMEPTVRTPDTAPPTYTAPEPPRRTPPPPDDDVIRAGAT